MIRFIEDEWSRLLMMNNEVDDKIDDEVDDTFKTMFRARRFIEDEWEGWWFKLLEMNDLKHCKMNDEIHCEMKFLWWKNMWWDLLCDGIFMVDDRIRDWFYCEMTR